MKEKFARHTKTLAGLAAITVLGALGCTCFAANSCRPPEARAEERPLAEPSGDTKNVTLTVEGMTCGACTVAIRTALKKLEGVKEAKVSYDEKRAIVEYNPQKVTPKEMVEAVNKLGYKASVAS